MASDGNIAIEVVPAAMNQETLSPSEDQPVIDSEKRPESEIDLNDSRNTNPDGVSSPASSTYADCDETEMPNSTNADEVVTKSDPVVEDEVIIIDCEEENVDSSPAIVAKNDECEEAYNVDEVHMVANGEIETNTDPKKDGEVDADYEYLDSEEYEVEGVSADEFGSHGSQEENDRENGDGEEVDQDEAIQKKLDDDEDRRNPQYIPKRGFYYEHDDRTADTGEESKVGGPTKEVPAPEPESKRKGRRSIPDGRWLHDMYKEDEQHSKSAQELIEVYGYNIRNEESAPKARRRRKYGRGPNRYSRKWDDEDGPAKSAGRDGRAARRPKPLPVQREEYDAEFPTLDRQPRPKAESREERRKSPAPPKPARNHDMARNEGDAMYRQDMARNEGDSKYRNERRRSPPRKYNSDHVVERTSRSFAKRIPTVAPSGPAKAHHNDAHDDAPQYKPTPVRTKFVVNNSYANSSRGRGVTHGKPSTRYTNHANENAEPARTQPEPRTQFLPANRGRATRLNRPCPSQGFSGKTHNDDELREMTEQMAAVNIRTNRNPMNRNDTERRAVADEMQNDHFAPVISTSRSKRYSYQRQRLLPDLSTEKNAMDFCIHGQSSIQSVGERGAVANALQTSENNALHQVSGVTVSHNSVPMITENQLTTAPPSNTSSLSVNAAASAMQSNTLAVSAPLIPLSAPPLTASGAALQANAPPLPIMGFFPHPQGFTNQAAPAQIYTREQNIMATPSNQAVQLVAFLPASPMLSNTNHTPPAQTAPPPPPPPPTYPTSVISYPQASPTQQSPQSFTSETYSMPPVTLAPIHQAEMYQSRGGVTYYNTRSQVKPRSPPPPRVKTAIPIVPPPNEN